nr:SLATT domain-containing protein [Phytohabitans suffuscus]
MSAPVRRPDDLGLPDLPALTWAPGGLRADLAALRAWAERVADEAVDWYMAEKRLKARWSRRLRSLAIVLATLGGAVPVVALASHRPEYGNWGTCCSPSPPARSPTTGSSGTRRPGCATSPPPP